ncbi:hypothetical protein Fot_02884 [Forsythia ovata]|uniref:Uncharacterized protein n=1 Tax=Forsythia ovata TaxID=205694 RepID=A0ABD1X902_9LAMI
MEVSKEIWVCSTNFLIWLPQRPLKAPNHRPTKEGNYNSSSNHRGRPRFYRRLSFQELIVGWEKIETSYVSNGIEHSAHIDDNTTKRHQREGVQKNGHREDLYSYTSGASTSELATRWSALSVQQSK